MINSTPRLKVLSAVFAVLCLYQSALVLDSAGVINARLLRPDIFTKGATTRTSTIERPGSREVRENARNKKGTPVKTTRQFK